MGAGLQEGPRKRNVAGGDIVVRNPATGDEVGRVPDMGAEDVVRLVRRASQAQPAWQNLPFADRARVMRDARTWLIENRKRVLSTVMQESGKVYEDALFFELFVVADALGFWARKAEGWLKRERVRSTSPLFFGKRLLVRYEPVGVVGVISPWNYPLTTGVGDAVPALLAGNAVVIKPSEAAPLSSLLAQEAFRAAGLPADVLQIATGGPRAGAALVDHVDMVMFTGSTAVGVQVGRRAAERLIPASLELGGKDPMVVLADADLERAADAAVYYAISNSGQLCCGVERVYVEERAHDEFVGRVVAKTRALRQGPPGGPGRTDVGAIVTPEQAEIIERQVADAVARGAQVLTGGAPAEGPGRFFEPTVLVGVTHEMDVMNEETFGPTIPIMSVRSADEAIEFANRSRYGLNSSVWTADATRGQELVERIDAGNGCVNDCVVNYLAVELPFGGRRDSGLGVRHGKEGIRMYCRQQAVLVTRRGPRRAPHMFPYSRRKTELIERLMALRWNSRSAARRLRR